MPLNMRYYFSGNRESAVQIEENEPTWDEMFPKRDTQRDSIVDEDGHEYNVRSRAHHDRGVRENEIWEQTRNLRISIVKHKKYLTALFIFMILITIFVCVMQAEIAYFSMSIKTVPVSDSFYLSNDGYLNVLLNPLTDLKFELKMKVKPENLTGILAAIHTGTAYLHLEMTKGNVVLTANKEKGYLRGILGPPKGIWEIGWHEITVNSYLPGQIELKVDSLSEVMSFDSKIVWNPYNTNDIFVGGHKNLRLEDYDTEKNFQGCIKDIYINGDLIKAESIMVAGDVQRNFCPIF